MYTLYIYIYTCVYIYINVCEYPFVYVYVHTHSDVVLHVCIYLYDEPSDIRAAIRYVGLDEDSTISRQGRRRKANTDLILF